MVNKPPNFRKTGQDNCNTCDNIVWNPKENGEQEVGCKLYETKNLDITFELDFPDYVCDSHQNGVEAKKKEFLGFLDEKTKILEGFMDEGEENLLGRWQDLIDIKAKFIEIFGEVE